MAWDMALNLIQLCNTDSGGEDTLIYWLDGYLPPNSVWFLRVSILK